MVCKNGPCGGDRRGPISIEVTSDSSPWKGYEEGCVLPGLGCSGFLGPVLQQRPPQQQPLSTECLLCAKQCSRCFK